MVIGTATCLKISCKFMMIPVMLSVIMRAAVYAQNCFGGVETFEKTSLTTYDNTISSTMTLFEHSTAALTQECVNLCKQQSQCVSFALDYTNHRCKAYSVNPKRNRNQLVSSSNINTYEKICLNGISKQEFESVCDHERLWAFERIKDSFLDGFVERELTNIGTREECAKTCLMEKTFICRSADYDENTRICRLSKEDRRTQPQAIRSVPAGSRRDYLENQCASAGKINSSITIL